MSAQTKIALVTGGSRGLGKDMAISIARKGIDVILTYRTNEKEANEVVQEIEGMNRKTAALQLDMAKFDSLDDFMQRFLQTLQAKFNSNTFDFIINNAGIGATVPFTEVTETLFDEFLNVHFKSVYFLRRNLFRT